jgi:hypothetical protein
MEDKLSVNNIRCLGGAGSPGVVVCHVGSLGLAVVVVLMQR